MASAPPSVAKRLAQIVFGVIFSLTCSGLVFGFAGLKPVLVSEGVYADLCMPNERRTDHETGRWLSCELQDIRLNLMFTVAAVATSVAGLPTGMILDRAGPKYASILGASLMIIGKALFGWGLRTPWFDSYIVGFFFIAIGGPFVCLSSFHLSNAFPAYAGLILSSITGSFDASSLPYAVYQGVYNATGGRLHVRAFFWVYITIPVLLIIEQLLLAPAETYERVVPEDETPTTTTPEADTPDVLGSDLNFTAQVMGSAFSRISHGEHFGDNDGMVKKLANKDPLTGLLYGKTAMQQISSKWFILLTLFVCIHMTRVNYLIQSVDGQTEFFTGSLSLSRFLTSTFALMLPVGGVLGIPFVGLLLDTRPFLDVTIVVFVLGLGFGLLGMTTSMVPQLIGMVIFALFRPLMYTTVSEALAKICGFSSFGTLYGLAMSLSGVVALVNAPLDVLVKTTLKGSYLPVDLVFLVLGALSSGALVLAVWRETKERQVQLAA